MLKGFKDFLFRGNLIELATAFVIGAAFTTLVNTFTSAIVKPILAAFMGNSSKPGLGFNLISGNDATFIDIGALINALIVFALTAAVLYFLFIVPYEKVQALQGKTEPEETETDADILSDIRDLLREGNGGTTVKVADPADG